ncbi:capsular polysaccharide biosynthesis protein [Uruburuella testudinis]|uniref:capsular polysaccharide biosynthesis protein n=1 Tax=Uruburuella testudinis TaxID=1282863 RepID=UPI003CC80990
MNTALIFSNGIWRIAHLAAFLPEYHLQKARASAPDDAVVIGWGLRPSTQKARAYAKRHGLPYIALEDGFLRSLGLGVAGWPPFALVHDDLGIYYDTTRPSRLEQLILAADKMPSEQLAEAERAMALIVADKLSKYNHAPDNSYRPSEAGKDIVLVVDQTFGDMAVQYGGADAASFETMFQTALAENPNAEIWVKTHPDVLSGKKRGYLTRLSSQAENLRLLAEDINPISLLQQVSKVYCVTSQMGFEALMCGKPVTTFGLPWYAGWGVSDDRHPQAADWHKQGRRAPRTLPQLFAAAYLQYSRYINPNTGEPGTVFDVIDYLAAARRLNEKLRGDLYCVGMSLWKRAVMRPFFNVPSCRLHFVSSLKKLQSARLPKNARLLVWSRGNDALIDFAHRQKLPLLRMEDGFIRSVGLGSNLVPPLSLVVDDMGIYFNAQTPSRLEHILQHHHFTAQDLRTASALQTALTEAAITKYNVGGNSLSLPDTDQKILLVPGQVEDDASIRYGSPKINKNLDLLKKVRTLNPDAYIVYKPHPDVVSGNRTGHIPAAQSRQFADQVASECDILTCLQQADEVHTMTSLTGFEALLRGKHVHCYGQPFYAGWGLTHDYLPHPRRTRRLSLQELIAGTLIYYPSYIHPDTRRMVDAASAITILKQQKKMLKNNNPLHRSWLSKQTGKIKQLYLSFKQS